MRRLATLLLGAVVACSSPDGPESSTPILTAHSASDGTIIRLGHIGASSLARAINGRGQVLAQGVNGCCGFLWEAGTLTSLGANASLQDVNDDGVIVGGLSSGHAYSQLNGVVTDLGVLIPGGYSDAWGINSAGQITGYASAADGLTHAVIWTGGQIQDLGTFPGLNALATDINNHGDVVGYTTDWMDPFHDRSFIWTTSGGLQDPGLPPNATGVQLLSINDAGVAVGIGEMDFGFFGQHAVLWSAATGWIDLNAAAGVGEFYSEAHDINSSGLVAGLSAGGPAGACASGGNPCAAVWFPDYSMRILPVLPGSSPSIGSYADGVNDLGQVAGTMPYGGGTILEATLWQVGTGNGAPIASTTGPYTGSEGVAVSFDATSSSDPDADPLSYTWSFGDGTPTVQGAVVPHVYADNSATPFTVLLTARDPSGHSSTVSTTATITNLAPDVSITPVDSITVGVAGPFAATFADSGAADGGYFVRYAWGDGSPADSFMQSGEGAVTQSHVYASVGSYRLVLTVRDKDLATGADTLMMLVVSGNSAPTASAGGPYAASEGTSLVFDASQSHDNDNDPLSYAWDFGDGGTGTGVTPNHTYLRPGSFTATVVVSDGRGLNSTASASATIANVAPSASAGPDMSVPVGAVVGPAFSFSDPGTAGGPWQVTINWGNGAIAVGTYPTPGTIGSGTWYNQTGRYVVTMTVTDLAGASDVDTLVVTITGNLPPVADAGGPYSGNEGSTLQILGGLSSDPNSDPLTYAWRFGDGGTSTLVNPTHVFTDNGRFTITLTVRDPSGLTSVATTTATIVNVPPTATFTKPASVNEGVGFTISLSGATDVSALDRAAGFQYAFDCGAGMGAFSAATSRGCPTQPDNGTLAVRGQVRDKDGGIRTYSATVTVKNVAPKVTITAGSATTFPSGTTFALIGNFADPGSADAPWSYSIAWGDGTAASTGTGARATPFQATHRYTRVGTWTVRMTVTDKDGGKGTSGAIKVLVQ